MKFCFPLLILTLSIYFKHGNCRRPRSRENKSGNDEENENSERRKTSSISDYLRDPINRAEGTTLQKKLFEKEISSSSILSNHFYYDSNETDKKNSFGEILTYVTPWNRKGYQLAKLMARKIRWLVPVWFQVKLVPTFYSNEKTLHIYF